jgi:single-stranded-DNA-specific exonuclease
MREQTWQIRPVDLRVAALLADELQIGRLAAEILARRGFTDPAAAYEFLHPDFRVHSPYLLDGMAEARRRVDRALGRGETIAVYGDYDADGITATFLLSEFLRVDMGADVVWRLPNRFADGYGISAEALDELAAAGVGLVITVDCGIGAHAEVAHAREIGLDVIVTDHHEPIGPLPEGIVVNPKLGRYPCRELAGVGVALKLAHALLQERGDDRVELPLALRPYLDVVAVGTVADVATLLDENRSLVAMGVGRLRSAPRPGLAALLEASETRPDDVDAATIGFRLAPRLNAAGRLDDAAQAVELLCATDRAAALPLAQRLGQLNAERQEIEAVILREALARLADRLPAAIVLSSPDWHEGVVGIVASRVVDQTGRPTILLSETDGVAKGSGRSIPAFDLLAGVAACSGRLLTYGGHQAACGLSLRTDDVASFGEALAGYADDRLSADDFRSLITVEAVAAGDELTLGLTDELDLFEPHGFGNPRPLLLLHGAEIGACRLTRNRRHMQCDVRLDGVTAPGVRFGFSAVSELRPGTRYDVPLAYVKNSFNGMVRPQALVKGAFELAPLSADLCEGECVVTCPQRVSGDEFWEALADADLPGATLTDGAATVAALRRERRLFDRRRRPVEAALASLVAAGGRLLVLVADVARRRPLLTRAAYLPELGRTYLYLNGACAVSRLGLAVCGDGVGGEPDVVMADTVTAAANPELVGAFDHVAFVDPPFDGGLFGEILLAVAPQACVHVLWGESEVDFTKAVIASDYDLEAVCRRVYRALAATGASDEPGLDAELFGRHGFLAGLPTLAAALSTLSEAGLLAGDDGKKGVRKTEGKIDLAISATYRRWHERFQTTTFLRHCLSIRL